MKRFFLSWLLACCGIGLFAETIYLETPNTRLLLRAEQGQDLQVLYYGDKSATVEDLNAASVQGSPALPAFGTVDMVVLPALQIQHADGDLNLEMRIQSTEYRVQTDFDELVVTLEDKLQPVTVRVYYKAWHNVDIIETWTEIEHKEKKPIVLKRFDSGTLTIPNGDNWFLHLHGDWAAEATPTVEPVTRGVKVIRNTDGARNAHLDAPEVMVSLDGVPRENIGRVLGAALCWSGNYEIRLSTLNSQLATTLYAGIDPQSSEYVLAPKTVFATPHLAFTYSTEGMGGVSRAFHRWARTCGMLHNGLAARDILLNSWEGIYFDITEERIISMMNDIASFGGELFVMDDGWFGAKYPRNNDSSSLGDWVVDTRKLPNGLKGIIDQRPITNDQRLKFGIWIEPEAVNTTSELYEKHPDWALQVKGRELKLGRGGTQLVLDMTNPKVQDFVFNLVDTLLTNYPEIAYIKWDANASIQNYGSVYLPNDRQNNLYIDYHLGLIKTLQRIRAKYPNVTIQNCASGGGRANYGLMPYFDEFWVSDNNDALQRVYIQWGTSYFFPSNAMAQHIGGSPYLMTGRVTPIKFRCDVAMSGRLGMELQPAHMTEEERAQCIVAIADYKQLREVIQLGNLYRLVSPYEQSQITNHKLPETQSVAALMYVNDAKDHAVLFAYGLTSFMKQAGLRIRLAGLDPARTYTLTERNIRVGEQPCALHGKSFTGAYLMSVGIDIPLSTEYSHDYPSRIFELK